MSNFNVQRDSWLEVAFEDRNKAYGAYRLRKESDTTTLKALFFGIGFGAICLGLFSFTTDDVKPLKPDAPKLPDPTVVVIKQIQDNKELEKPQTKGTPNPIKNLTPDTNVPPRIVDRTVIEPVKEPTNPNPSTPYNPNGDPNGNPGPAGTPTGTVSTPTTPSNTEGTGTSIYKGVLGVEARFPGGIDKFRTYVADNYKVPSNFSKDFLTINLVFTIAKDGSMTDIRMINNADKALEKEAIRVLKAMNKKWSPGMVDGKAVNSERTFSIKIDLREIEEE